VGVGRRIASFCTLAVFAPTLDAPERSRAFGVPPRCPKTPIHTDARKDCTGELTSKIAVAVIETDAATILVAQAPVRRRRSKEVRGLVRR
jgi:hypothetical protein